MRDTLLPLLRASLLPTLASLFLVGGAAGARAVLREVFIVKYEAGGGGSPGLATHRDGYPLSFSALLNPPTDFEGGGTQLETIRETVCCTTLYCSLYLLSATRLLTAPLRVLAI